MKQKMKLWCLGAFCVLMLAGCGANPAGPQVPTSTPSSETAAGEDTFTSEEVKTFTFEGEEYTFPLSCDVLVEQGWTITDETYELFQDEERNAGFLTLESGRYPGVEMNIRVYDNFNSNSALGGVEELVEEFETNGIWGIELYPVDDETEVANYPDFSIQGVTFGSPAEDIVSTFGTDLGSTSREGESYHYSEWANTWSGCSSLHFEMKDDQVYAISATYYE